MGQDNIAEFLDKHWKSKKWWLCKDIAKELNVCLGSACHSLARLRKGNSILFKRAGRDYGPFLYHSAKTGDDK
jgi:hypothetical protein